MRRRLRIWTATATALVAAAAAGAACAQAGATGPNPASVRTTSASAFIKTKMALFAHAGPSDESTVTDEVVAETVLPISGCSGGWCRVVLSRAAPSYIRQNLVDMVTPRH